MDAPDFRRDRWDRPLILPRGAALGDKGEGRKPYARASSLGGVLDDSFGLTKWKTRLTAVGIAANPGLAVEVLANREDKKALDKTVEKALDKAGANDRSALGTAIHLLTEQHDRGEQIPALPPEYQADLDAYRYATVGMTPIAIEKRVACDGVEAAGTTDRIWEFGGERYIGDVKTGSKIDLGAVKIAVQLAIYTRSDGYDPLTDERDELRVNQDWAIVLHLPAGEGRAALWWFNVNRGWDLAQQARDVKATQKLKLADIAYPFPTATPEAA